MVGPPFSHRPCVRWKAAQPPWAHDDAHVTTVATATAAVSLGGGHGGGGHDGGGHGGGGHGGGGRDDHDGNWDHRGNRDRNWERYQNAKVKDAVVATNRSEFGRRSSGSRNFWRARQNEVAPLERDPGVVPDASSRVADARRGRRPPQETRERSVVATRASRPSAASRRHDNRESWRGEMSGRRAPRTRARDGRRGEAVETTGTPTWTAPARECRAARQRPRPGPLERGAPHPPPPRIRARDAARATRLPAGARHSEPRRSGGATRVERQREWTAARRDVRVGAATAAAGRERNDESRSRRRVHSGGRDRTGTAATSALEPRARDRDAAADMPASSKPRVPPQRRRRRLERGGGSSPRRARRRGAPSNSTAIGDPRPPASDASVMPRPRARGEYGSSRRRRQPAQPRRRNRWQR